MNKDYEMKLDGLNLDFFRVCIYTAYILIYVIIKR